MTSKVLLGFEQGFLVGLIEADGWIGLYHHRKVVRPGITIINTDKDTLEHARRIYDSMGIKSHLYTRHTQLKYGKKMCWELRVMGWRQTRKLLPLLKERLVSRHRKEQLRKVIRRLETMQKKRDALETRNSEMFKRIGKGESVQEVAPHFGLKPHSLYELMRRRGLNVHKLKESSIGI